MKPAPEAEAVLFTDLGLSEQVVRAVKAVGYETASPIQAATIPAMLEGVDILGQAQTGTGKTAAFALPILSRLDMKRRVPQALVMVPTRELAIQVAEAFQKYASGLNGFHVLPIYGGQSYVPQLSALKRGPQVIVGTPGRIIDHLERGTLSLENINCVVLDEADEMLAMGFADAMDAILAQTPAEKQVALFSATMAPNIRRIAQRHLRNPREIIIKGAHRHRGQHPPALLDGQRHAQARCADPHRRGGRVRRHAGVRAHQAIHRRSVGAAAGTRFRRRRAERRHPAGTAREDRGAAEGGQVRHPRGY